MKSGSHDVIPPLYSEHDAIAGRANQDKLRGSETQTSCQRSIAVNPLHYMLGIAACGHLGVPAGAQSEPRWTGTGRFSGPKPSARLLIEPPGSDEVGCAHNGFTPVL